MIKYHQLIFKKLDYSDTNIIFTELQKLLDMTLRISEIRRAATNGNVLPRPNIKLRLLSSIFTSRISSFISKLLFKKTFKIHFQKLDNEFENIPWSNLYVNYMIILHDSQDIKFNKQNLINYPELIFCLL
jgi:hypothetical protein